MAYKVCGFTNCECMCGEGQVFGDNITLNEALNLFMELSNDPNSLDFSELDEYLSNEYFGDEGELDGLSYGGHITVYETASTDGDWDREIVSVRIERDILNNRNTIGSVWFGEEIGAYEQNLYEFYRAVKKALSPDASGDVEISASCYSEKEDASVGFGISFDPEEKTLISLDLDWIDIGMSESFWENYQEFEPGVEKADNLRKTNPTLSWEEAMFQVFGHFSIVFTIGGRDLDLNLKLNIDESMYYLLKECF